MANQTTNVVLGVAAVLLLGGLGIWLYRPPQPDCNFLEWKHELGIELESKVGELEQVKGKLSISEAEVRTFDDLMKDFALKYDAACQDFRAGSIEKAEFACLRRNMDGVLDSLRQFSQAVTAAKTVQDATAQREIIVKALTDLRRASQAQFKTNCASAIGVSPTKLSFVGQTFERSVQIANRGNNDVRFAIESFPDGFVPQPGVGHVRKGESVTVAMIRTILPPPQARPLTFHIRTNFNDDVEIEIDLDTENLALWKTLGSRAVALSPSGIPTVDDALRVVNQQLTPGSPISESDRLLVASTALFAVDQRTAAEGALDRAVQLDTKIAPQLSAMTLRTLIASDVPSSSVAVANFTAAKNMYYKDMYGSGLAVAGDPRVSHSVYW